MLEVFSEKKSLSKNKTHTLRNNSTHPSLKNWLIPFWLDPHWKMLPFYVNSRLLFKISSKNLPPPSPCLPPFFPPTSIDIDILGNFTFRKHKVLQQKIKKRKMWIFIFEPGNNNVIRWYFFSSVYITKNIYWSDCSETRVYNHLVRKQTLNHLAILI